MIIGIPRERKQGECRVGITPDGASQLVRRGHEVIVEKDAGRNSGYLDEDYLRVGAKISTELEQVWSRAELLVKVKEPAPEEFALLREGITVFSFLHPAALPDMVAAMLDSQAVGIDYDLVTSADGRFPILEPMSVIAGKLSIQCGAAALQSNLGGRGVLLGGTPGVQPGRVLVIGAGAAGSNAAQVAIGMGAEVTIMDIDSRKLAPFVRERSTARTLHATPRAIEREIQEADLVVGAVLVPGDLAPKLITKDLLSSMKRGAVLVDICIDQGGFAETSRPTSLSTPTYVEQGVVHYCVPNMPALVPRTSTEALTNQTLPWISLIAEQGIRESLLASTELRKALVAARGRLTNSVVAQALNYQKTPPSEVEALIRTL